MDQVEDAVDIAAQLATLSEVEDAARRALTHDVWDFLETGAGEEQTLAENRRAFNRWSFRPRVMTGMGAPRLGTSFCGIDLAMPVITAPFGADSMLHPEGQVAVARANARFGTASMVPEASSFAMESVAEAAPAAARIMQLHALGTDDELLAHMERAAAAGYGVLCVTLDCPTAGWRERGKRNRLEFDFAVLAGNFDLERLWAAVEEGEPTWSWDRLREVIARAPLPCIVKGILTHEDAEAAVAAGAAGVIVSNHGGRQLDGAPASLDQLPEVVAAIGDRVPIGLDSGVRRGTDVLKAVGLGADVVLIGRLAAYGLVAAGEPGVVRVLELLRDEIATSMSLLGCPDIESLGADRMQRVPA